LDRRNLSPHDQQELTRLSAFLSDAASMPKAQLYSKHQQYLGLSDAELVAAGGHVSATLNDREGRILPGEECTS
jgi:hypothetical protein